MGTRSKRGGWRGKGRNRVEMPRVRSMTNKKRKRRRINRSRRKNGGVFARRVGD